MADDTYKGLPQNFSGKEKLAEILGTPLPAELKKPVEKKEVSVPVPDEESASPVVKGPVHTQHASQESNFPWTFIFIVIIVVLLVAGAVAAYSYLMQQTKIFFMGRL